MAKEKKLPFNCLLPAGTLKAIREQADVDKCSQADVVHRAVALLCFGEEVGVVAPQFVSKSQLKRVEAQTAPAFPRMREKGDKTR